MLQVDNIRAPQFLFSSLVRNRPMLASPTLTGVILRGLLSRYNIQIPNALRSITQTIW